MDNNMPGRAIYPIGVVAELLEVHPRTLRLYEQAGFICPLRRKGRRYYSESDIEWLRCVRYLIHEEKISVEGLRRLLELQPCWEIRRCGREQRERCCRNIKGQGQKRLYQCKHCGNFYERDDGERTEDDDEEV